MGRRNFGRRHLCRRHLCLAALGVVGALSGSVVSAVPLPGPLALAVSAPLDVETVNASAFTELAPCRLIDTRETSATTATVFVVGRCGVAAGASAVAVSVVATGAEVDGFVTAWGAGALVRNRTHPCSTWPPAKPGRRRP